MPKTWRMIGPKWCQYISFDWRRSCWHHLIGQKSCQLTLPLRVHLWLDDLRVHDTPFGRQDSWPTWRWFDATSGSLTWLMHTSVEGASPFCCSASRTYSIESLAGLLISFIIFPDGASPYLLALDVLRIFHPSLIFWGWSVSVFSRLQGSIPHVHSFVVVQV